MTSAWLCAVAAINPIRASRTACCIGSVVAPSNVNRLMTVSDSNLSPDEPANGIGHVGIIAPEPVNPTDHQRVAFPENVEQPFPLRSLAKACGDA